MYRALHKINYKTVTVYSFKRIKYNTPSMKNINSNNHLIHSLWLLKKSVSFLCMHDSLTAARASEKMFADDMSAMPFRLKKALSIGDLARGLLQLTTWLIEV